MIKIDWQSLYSFIEENHHRMKQVWMDRRSYQDKFFIFLKNKQDKNWQFILMIGCVVVSVLFIAIFVLPLYLEYDTLQTTFATQQDQWHLLKINDMPEHPMQTVVVRRAGWEDILKSARDQGIMILQFEATSDSKTNASFHFVAESNLMRWMAWLKTVAQLETSLRFLSLDMQTEANGQLRMNARITLTHESETVAWPALPIGNPFCHAVSLQEANQLSRIPLLLRYPIADIQFIGTGESKRQQFGLVKFPGGATASVSVGDHMGLESATLVQFSSHEMHLKLLNQIMIKNRIEAA